MTIRKLLEFALCAAVCTHNVKQVKKTLVYGRENTFLLSVTDNLLQIALRMTEDDGPHKGDYAVLRTLITNATVVKPVMTIQRQKTLMKADKLAEKKLLKMMKIGLGMKLSKKARTDLERDLTHQRQLLGEMNKLQDDRFVQEIMPSIEDADVMSDISLRTDDPTSNLAPLKSV